MVTISHNAQGANVILHTHFSHDPKESEFRWSIYNNLCAWQYRITDVPRYDCLGSKEP